MSVKRMQKYYIRILMMNMASLEFRLNFVTFALSVDILASTKNSALGLKMCATTGGIKNYKSVINKKKND